MMKILKMIGMITNFTTFGIHGVNHFLGFYLSCLPDIVGLIQINNVFQFLVNILFTFIKLTMPIF